MIFRPHYSTSANKDLEGLDSKTAQRILDKIDFYCTQPNPLRFAKKLTNHDGGQYRFRIGDYRALFDIDARGNITILLILAVRHRREVYD